MARNGERILLSWRPMESTSVCETFSEKSAAGWLRALFSVFPTSVYILGFEFAWILTSLCLIKKAVSAAMLRLFLCLCLPLSLCL